jgi:O-antigen ligase/Flp pilus assembly protein TadD
MNNTTINTVLKYSIIIGLALIAFIPLYVANSNFFPFITGKAFAFRIIVEIVLVLWLVLVLREKGTVDAGTDRSIAPRMNYLTITVTVFTVVALIADLLGYNPLRSIWSNFERMEGWMTIIHLWAYFIVMSSIFGNTKNENSEGRKNWYRFLNVLLLSGTITAFYGLFQFFGLAEVHQSASRVDASLGNSAYMGAYMIFNAFLALYMAIIAWGWKVAKKDGAMALISIYSLIFVFSSFIIFQTATRGSILGWVAGILITSGIYAIFGRSKKEGNVEKGQSNLTRYVSGGLIVLVIILGFSLYKAKNVSWIKNNQVLGRLSSISLSDTKTQARGYIWPMAVKGIFDNPKTAIIGIGQENFNYIFNRDYTPLMYGHEQWFDRAHSVFLDWLVAGGLLGLLAYLALYVLALFYIWKADLSIGQKSVLIGLLVAYGIHNIFVFDNQTSYVMFFTLLAMISALVSGKKCKLLGDPTKNMSEDAVVVRDYIFVPIIVIAFISGFYFINIRVIQANTRLITALRSCSDGKTLSVKTFENALKLNQTTANQEIREQLISCAGNVLNSSQIPAQIKTDFYELTKKEIDRQITETPNDARMYVIAGSFYNSLGKFDISLPILEKANKLTPGKQAVKFDLATNYINTNRAEDAIAIAKDAYESAPDYELSKIAYALALVNGGKEKIAHEIFGNDPKIFTDERMIGIYGKLGNYAKVIEIYKELVDKKPEDPQVKFFLAAAYAMDDQTWTATNELKSLIEKFPQTKTQIEPLIKQLQEGKNPFKQS